MSRLISALLCACLLACGLSQAAQAAPLQFAYKGAGCDGLKAMPTFEATLGRKADGVIDFVNYLADWPRAVSASKWSWCWRGLGYRLACRPRWPCLRVQTRSSRGSRPGRRTPTSPRLRPTSPLKVMPTPTSGWPVSHGGW